MSESTSNQPSETFIRALTESQTALRGYCQASLGHGEEAKEAQQRTSIVLWRKCHQWDPNTEFLRWALTVAKFEVLGVLRDRNRERERFVFDSDIVELMVDEASETDHELSDQEEALEVCLQKLSEPNRLLLSSYYADRQSIQEISQACGKGISAVKVMLLRLRQKLGECITGQLTKEPTV
jgi:RNA polymerase sigma-70 factor, ECF subfamily